MRKRLFGLAVAAALVSAPTLAPAALTLQTPGFGTERAVNGSGSAPNAHVELFINGVSQGSVKADNSGNFQFVADLTTGDEVFVTQSIAWNFDEDTEGWTGNQWLELSQDNGNLVATFIDAGSGPFDPFMVAPAGEIRSDIHRVLEYRFRNNSPANAFQFFQAGPGGLDPGADQFATIVRSNGTEFITDQYSLDVDPSANTTTWVANSPVSLLRIDPFTTTGDVPGDYFGTTIEFDFIRIKEYYSLEFNTDGDFQGYTVTNDGINASVAGGVLTYELDDTNGDSIIDPNFGYDATKGVSQSSINSGYFTHFAIGGAVDSSASAVGFFFEDAGAGFAAGGNFAGFTGLTFDGSRFDFAGDIAATGATWSGAESPVIGGSVGTTVRFDVPDNGGDAGDTVEIDYLRFQTANPYGPSAPVTVSSDPGDDPDPEPQVNWPIQVVETSTPPTLDGVIDTASEWAPAGFPVPIALNLSTLTIADPYFPNNTHNGQSLLIGGATNTGAADISGVMYFMYDADNFYIGVEVTDDNNSPGATAPNGGDAFQLCLDYDNTFGAGGTDAGIYIPSWNATTNTSDFSQALFFAFWPTSSPADFTGAEWQMTVGTGGNYVLEASIPWTVFSANGNTNTVPPATGYVFNGMPILLDIDNGGDPKFLMTGGAGSGAGAIGSASLWQTTFELTDDPVELPPPPASTGGSWNLYQ